MSSAGGKRVGAGRKKSAPTKKRGFYLPISHFDELVKQIKALISSYNNA